MGIHRGGEERTGPHQVSNRASKIGLGVGHTDDAHGAMDVEEDAVDRHGRAKLFEKLCLDRLVEGSLDRPARECSRVHKREPVDTVRELAVAVKDLVAAKNGEVVGSTAVWREGARLDVNAADRRPKWRAWAHSLRAQSFRHPRSGSLDGTRPAIPPVR